VEGLAKAQQSAIDKQVKAQNALNESNQKAITLEQAKAKYVSQGYGKTDSTRLARLEVSGADVTTLNNYKSAIEATTRATQALTPAVEKVTTSHSNFLDQVKGIAIYAALSAAIYGVMTAMTNLAVATVQMADEYTSIQNRMKLYVKDANTLIGVNQKLAGYSMENNVGLRETATLFSRLAPSMQKLGANTAAITTVVDAFGKSMRIGGATAMEAASATIQFSQAMASGKLAGDEFRSISEASPRFLKAIAEGSGIAADKLKEMSAAGMLTTEVISKALLKEYPKLIEENKKLGITMEQGANAIKTGFLVAIGEFNEGAGITKALGEAMLDLAQGMLTGAQNARQFGKDINDWFSANAGTINTVVDAFKLLATVIATRYVASLVLATAASVKLTYQTSALAAATTASMRAFVLGATAATAFGRAAQTAFAFMGGWAGIALTVAGVATSYLLLRDNAAEASKKLVESSEYADMTTNSFKQLNAEQQKNARASLIKSMSDVNEKLDEQANTVNRVLLSYVQLRQMQGKMNNKQLDDVINKTT
ncbi:MAG: tape measure protein, partial [Ignavibacteria bacterium]